MTEVLRRVFVVAYANENMGGWDWYGTAVAAEAAFDQKAAAWSDDGTVRLLVRNIPILANDAATTDWIQHNAYDADFADWALLKSVPPVQINLQYAGYTYKAENYCTHHALHLLEQDMDNPLFDVEAMVALNVGDDAILKLAAEIMEIDAENPYSYSSDVFPKPFTAEQAEEAEFCPVGMCGHRFRDGQRVLPFTVTGVRLTDGTLIFGHIGVGHFGEHLHGCLDEEDDGIIRWGSHVMAVDPDEAMAVIAARSSLDEELPTMEEVFGGSPA